MNTLIYDVEVLRGPDEVDGGWNNPWGMGFGTAVVYDYDRDLYHFFGAEKLKDLIGLLTTGLVVSFNGIKFDNRVLFGNDYNAPNSEVAWRDYDILLEVVKAKYGLSSVAEAEKKLGDPAVHDGSIGLDGLSEGTLNLHKTGHGAKAPQLIREAKWAEVFAYNLNDVRLTRKLFDFIRQYGYLIDRAGTKLEIRKPD